MLYYTRDDNGDRALWIELPAKIDGEWSVNGNFSHDLILSDWNGEDEQIDAVIGKGVHGLRKGSIAELELGWRRWS